MSPKTMVWLSVLLSAVAQVFLKHGLNRVAVRGAGKRMRPISLLLRAATEFWVGLWAVCFVFATALWLLGVQRLDLSYAFPLLSLGYILVNFLSILLFRERVDGLRWAAVALISLGVMFIAAS